MLRSQRIYEYMCLALDFINVQMLPRCRASSVALTKFIKTYAGADIGQTSEYLRIEILMKQVRATWFQSYHFGN